MDNAKRKIVSMTTAKSVIAPEKRLVRLRKISSNARIMKSNMTMKQANKFGE